MKVKIHIDQKTTHDFIVFSSEGIGEFYDVMLTKKFTRERMNNILNTLDQKTWFSTDLRNQFIDICEKQLNEF